MGEIELVDRVLILKRIHVTYHLEVGADADMEKVQRAFAAHAPRCPVYRSIHPQIEVTTSLNVETAEGDD